MCQCCGKVAASLERFGFENYSRRGGFYLIIGAGALVLNQLLSGGPMLSVSYIVLICSALMYILGYMRSETVIPLAVEAGRSYGSMGADVGGSASA